MIFNSCINNHENEKTISKTDYSFGLDEAKEIKRELRNEEYTKVNDLIAKLSSDNVSHVVDYLALNSGEQQLKKWHLESQESSSSLLVLGAFYAHKGWAIRGNSYAFEVNEDDAFSFIDYQNEALKFLSQINDDNVFAAEMYSRLIRIHMGLGNDEKGKEAFEKCTQLDPLKVWAYIHRLEAIQPKWGGTLEETINFKSTLPNSDIIKQIIDLKLIVDSSVSGENLISINTIDVKKHALAQIKKIDNQLSSNPQKSILRFVIYNYMVGISQEIGNEDFLNKYFRKMENHYTLYPFGIME
jgi:tetratricopeptide (TPR) repeat protein